MTISTCYGDKYPSKYLFKENIHLFNDVIHVYSWLVSWKKRASVPFLMNVSCWKCADDGCLGTMVSLLNGLLYASLQLPLDNRENKNSRNVCLSQIRENIFPLKFLLIQYNFWVVFCLWTFRAPDLTQLPIMVIHHQFDSSRMREHQNHMRDYFSVGIWKTCSIIHKINQIR